MEPNDDHSNDDAVPPLLRALLAVADSLIKAATPEPTDPTNLRVAKHGFRYLSIGAGAALIAVFVLRPGADDPAA